MESENGGEFCRGDKLNAAGLCEEIIVGTVEEESSSFSERPGPHRLDPTVLGVVSSKDSCEEVGSSVDCFCLLRLFAAFYKNSLVGLHGIE